MCASLVEMGKQIFSGQFQWLGCFSSERPPWRNRLARSAVNRKVGGSSPPGGGIFLQIFPRKVEKILTLAGLEPAIP